ncbi:hypothetical protein Scep_020090 [Stephania cephalantha]|uniref:Uncharacterized protein n=1 Tax=Stephania cephalantha TaxID=152367 RepID=A0AAP0NQH7_9MAGN
MRMSESRVEMTIGEKRIVENSGAETRTGTRLESRADAWDQYSGLMKERELRPARSSQATSRRCRGSEEQRDEQHDGGQRRIALQLDGGIADPATLQHGGEIGGDWPAMQRCSSDAADWRGADGQHPSSSERRGADGTTRRQRRLQIWRGLARLRGGDGGSSARRWRDCHGGRRRCGDGDDRARQRPTVFGCEVRRCSEAAAHGSSTAAPAAAVARRWCRQRRRGNGSDWQ